MTWLLVVTHENIPWMDLWIRSLVKLKLIEILANTPVPFNTLSTLVQPKIHIVSIVLLAILCIVIDFISCYYVFEII